MKRIFKSYILLLAVLVFFTACEENAIEPLSGKYDIPEEYTLTNLVDNSSERQVGGTRIFTLKLATEGVTATYDEGTETYSFSGSGNYFSIDLVGDDYFLKEGTYTVSNHENASVGNYIAGYDMEEGGTTHENLGSCFFSVSQGEQSPAKIAGGNLYVEKVENDYTIYATMTLEDGTVLRLEHEGEIIYEPDPYVPTYTYTVATETPAMGGDGSVPIEGTTKHKLTIYADGVMSTYLEVVTEESATSLTGSYSIKDGLDAAGQVANGYYFDWAWYGGAGTLEGGSYYLKNGEKMFLRESGSISITDENGVLSITGDDLPILDVETLKSSNGETWTTLAEPGTINVVSAAEMHDFSNLVSASALDLSLYGGSGYLVTVKIATDGVVATYDEATFAYTYTGTGKYLSLDFNRDDATLPAGTYNVVDNTIATVGDCVAGYPNPYGAGTWGSVSGSVESDVPSELEVAGGAIEISVDGDTYTIKVDITTDEGVVKGSYTGAITL